MRMSERAKWVQRLRNITKANIPMNVKDKRLASFMSDMETAYEIPVHNRKERAEFSDKHPEVMEIYCAAAKARSLVVEV